MELVALSLITLAGAALFAAMGGIASYAKNRRPIEGCVLGAILGPIGVFLELRRPVAHRPMVDRGAWNSFRSLVDYQSEPALLQLTHKPNRIERIRTR